MLSILLQSTRSQPLLLVFISKHFLMMVQRMRNVRIITQHLLLLHLSQELAILSLACRWGKIFLKRLVVVETAVHLLGGHGDLCW